MLKNGKAVRRSFLFLKYVPNKGPLSRWGFAVPVRVAKKAVERNRVKRILANAVQESGTHGIKGYDVVVVAGTGITLIEPEEIREAVKSLLRQARLSSN